MALSRGEGSTPSFFSWAQAHLAWQLKEDEPGTADMLVPLAAPRRASHTLAWPWRGFARGSWPEALGPLWPFRRLWVPVQGMRAASGPPWHRGRPPLTPPRSFHTPAAQAAAALLPTKTRPEGTAPAGASDLPLPLSSATSRPGELWPPQRHAERFGPWVLGACGCCHVRSGPERGEEAPQPPR